MGCKNEPRDKSMEELTFSGKNEMSDLIDFERETLGNCVNGAISPTSYSSKRGQCGILPISKQTETYETSSVTTLSTVECDGKIFYLLSLQKL